jgi:subtilisin family serine protease
MPLESERSHRKAGKGSCKVLVVDTGVFPAISPSGGSLSSAALAAKTTLASVNPASDSDPWDADANRVLDPSAGHGTFIAGLFANLAPGADVTGERGLTSFGDTDDVMIARTLLDKFDLTQAEPSYDIVSMSFGGFCEDDDPPVALARAISRIQTSYRTSDDIADPPDLIRERVLFVASAGNDASCRPTWPASFENVVAVGSLGPTGPAWFTNWGPWVDACAPGVDIVSTFFDLTGEAGYDGEDFDGWATWSGTSFSAPIVAAQVAWEWMCRHNEGRPGDAAAWLLDRPAQFRYPGLGTVVNMA